MKLANRPGLIRDPLTHRWKRITPRHLHGGVVRGAGAPPEAHHHDDFASGIIAALWALMRRAWDAFVARILGGVVRVREAAGGPLDDADNIRLYSEISNHARVFLASMGLSSTVGEAQAQALERLRSEDVIGTAFRVGVLEAKGPGAFTRFVTEEDARRWARGEFEKGEMEELKPFTFNQIAAEAAGISADDAKWLQVARDLRVDPLEEAMLKVVRAQVGPRLRPVVYRVGEGIVSRLAQIDAAAAQQAMLTGIPQGADVPDLAAMMADLAGEDGVWVRDWIRVARTELARVHNWGHLIATLQALPENAGAKGAGLHVPDVLVFKLPESEEPCRYCNALWLLEDGTPRLYRLRELILNGDNAVGEGGQPRRAERLLPTIGPVHPNCLCGPVHFLDDAALGAFPGLAQQAQAIQAPSPG